MNEASSADIRVLLAEDHPVFRRGLAGLLASEDGFEVIGEAGDGNEAVSLARELRPDVILMDIDMPECDGLSACRQILGRDDCSDPKIVFLSVSAADHVVVEATEAGAVGFLLKEADLDEITRAITVVNKGESYYSPKVAALLRKQFGRHMKLDSELARTGLTSRELEVLCLMAKAYSNAMIARELFISERTVKNHVGAIFRKLDVTDRSQAIVHALKTGLVTLD